MPHLSQKNIIEESHGIRNGYLFKYLHLAPVATYFYGSDTPLYYFPSATSMLSTNLGFLDRILNTLTFVSLYPHSGLHFLEIRSRQKLQLWWQNKQYGWQKKQYGWQNKQLNQKKSEIWQIIENLSFSFPKIHQKTPWTEGLGPQCRVDDSGCFSHMGHNVISMIVDASLTWTHDVQLWEAQRDNGAIFLHHQFSDKKQ
jgi:hypothetical protein